MLNMFQRNVSKLFCSSTTGRKLYRLFGAILTRLPSDFYMGQMLSVSHLYVNFFVTLVLYNVYPLILSTPVPTSQTKVSMILLLIKKVYHFQQGVSSHTQHQPRDFSSFYRQAAERLEDESRHRRPTRGGMYSWLVSLTSSDLSRDLEVCSPGSNTCT